MGRKTKTGSDTAIMNSKRHAQPLSAAPKAVDPILAALFQSSVGPRTASLTPTDSK